MLSNHLHDGMGISRADREWSPLPRSSPEDDPVVAAADEVSVESLDYEIIENYAYREEQVEILKQGSSGLNRFFFLRLGFSGFSGYAHSYHIIVFLTLLSFHSELNRRQAQKRGRLCTGYSMMVKWFFSLLIGIGEPASFFPISASSSCGR